VPLNKPRPPLSNRYLFNIRKYLPVSSEAI